MFLTSKLMDFNNKAIFLKSKLMDFNNKAMFLKSKLMDLNNKAMFLKSKLMDFNNKAMFLTSKLVLFKSKAKFFFNFCSIFPLRCLCTTGKAIILKRIVELVKHKPLLVGKHHRGIAILTWKQLIALYATTFLEKEENLKYVTIVGFEKSTPL